MFTDTLIPHTYCLRYENQKVYTILLHYFYQLKSSKKVFRNATELVLYFHFQW